MATAISVSVATAMRRVASPAQGIRQRGIALVTTLLLLLVMLALVTTTFELNTTDYLDSISYRDASRGFLYADSTNRVAVRTGFRNAAPIAGNPVLFNFSNAISVANSMPSLENDILNFNDIDAVLSGGASNNFYYEVSCNIAANACAAPAVVANGLNALQMNALAGMPVAVNDAVGLATTGLDPAGAAVEFLSVRRYVVQFRFLGVANAPGNANPMIQTASVGGGPIMNIANRFCNVSVRTQIQLINDQTSTINQGYRVQCAP